MPGTATAEVVSASSTSGARRRGAGDPQRRSFVIGGTSEGDQRLLYAQGRPMAKDSSGSGSNWATGTSSAIQTQFQTPVESRFFFTGTVTGTDMSRATDKREKDRLGIFGTSNSYAGSYGRVTSEPIGRDLNPLGRGVGRAYLAGMMDFGQLFPALPNNQFVSGTGNSVNNPCRSGNRQCRSTNISPVAYPENDIDPGKLPESGWDPGFQPTPHPGDPGTLPRIPNPSAIVPGNAGGGVKPGVPPVVGPVYAIPCGPSKQCCCDPAAVNEGNDVFMYCIIPLIAIILYTFLLCLSLCITLWEVIWLALLCIAACLMLAYAELQIALRFCCVRAHEHILDKDAALHPSTYGSPGCTKSNVKEQCFKCQTWEDPLPSPL